MTTIEAKMITLENIDWPVCPECGKDHPEEIERKTIRGMRPGSLQVPKDYDVIKVKCQMCGTTWKEM